MPDFGFSPDAALWPLKWLVELVLVGVALAADGDRASIAAAGITWVLAIVGLVIVVRAALIPLFVRQIKSQRRDDGNRP